MCVFLQKCCLQTTGKPSARKLGWGAQWRQVLISKIKSAHLQIKSVHISADPCRNTETWCRYNPSCDHEEVQVRCSKHCKTCSSKCKDLKNWCKFEPKCDVEDVRKNCPKWCRICVDLQTKNAIHQ